MCKYQSDEDRSKAYKSQQNSYSMQDWICDVCDCVVKLGNKTNHLNTKKHYKNQLSTSGDSNEYSYKTWRGEDCDIEINLHSKENHLSSKRHITNESLCAMRVK